ncbi:MAG: hypothetical protein HYR91_02325 [Flavobacteriia bacterium]|nr:hypothetical protein [Flavobacteriia bacterium]
MKNYQLLSLAILTISLFACSNRPNSLKRQREYQLSLEDDFTRIIDRSLYKHYQLKNQALDITNPEKVILVKAKLKLLNQFEQKIISIFEFIEKYKLNLLKTNGENINAKKLVSQKYNLLNFSKLGEINLLQLKHQTFSFDLNNEIFIHKIKLQCHKIIPLFILQENEFDFYLKRLELNSSSVAESINKLTLLEIKIAELMGFYITEIYKPFEIFQHHLTNVKIVYDAPTFVKKGEICEIKLYLAGIDTTSKPLIFLGNKKILEYQKNAGIIRLKAKADSANFQVLKGKIKFINEFGEPRFFYWHKRIEIIE